MVGQAQKAVAPDTAFVQKAVRNAVQAYKETVGMQTHLYNGTEYVDDYKPYLEGHPFFGSNTFSAGSIYYDGAWHKPVFMLYDVLHDDVIITHNVSGNKMKLINAKIDTFRVQGHTFARFGNGHEALQPGMYDVLYSKQTKFLVRRSKNLQERATDRGMEGEYHVDDRRYICKDGTCQPVSSKRSVYAALRDKKKQLRKYAAREHLRFRKKREETILALVTYYDSLADEKEPGSDTP